MTKRINAKYKINRRLGENLWGRPKSPVNKRTYGPGQTAQTRQQKLTDYGTQLRAKQKLRKYYGNIGEKQFRNLYKKAAHRPGDTGENLIQYLESRLDAVVYRMKFVPTVFSSRQFINHCHILVNGSRVNIPSYQVTPGDVIEIRDRSKDIPMVLIASESAERDVPDYMEVDTAKKIGTFLRAPEFAEVPYPVQMEPHLVIEFYSR